MKKILIFGIALILVGSISSCAKCLSCKNSIEKTKICTKDKDDQDDFNDQESYWEARGYKCTQSSEAL